MNANHSSGKTHNASSHRPSTARLAGKPWSREWLIDVTLRGMIDGFIVIDAERSAMIFDGSSVKIPQLTDNIRKVYGSCLEVYLPVKSEVK